MLTMEECERIRIAHFVEHKSVRQIAKDLQVARKTVTKALSPDGHRGYQLTVPRAAPILGAYHARIDALLAENESLPRKQRRTIHQIYLQLRREQYTGSESSVRTYVWLKRKHSQTMDVFLPLEFDPGDYAQVDWGEAEVVLGGERQIAQVFVMRLCYSRRLFVRTYPSQRQEAFFDGHASAFEFFHGVPRHITYDNLTTAVQQILVGRQRAEQRLFVALRSHYLFESRFCSPGEGHEKGGVESAVGFARRNFLSPPPQHADWDALNADLQRACNADMDRTVSGQAQTIRVAFAREQAQLTPLPAERFACCVNREVTLNQYSQVTFETNTYSVPADRAAKHLTLKAYPFHVTILRGADVLCTHPRCYRAQQTIVNWLDYLPLLVQRPGAFEHSQAVRSARPHWPPVFEQLLSHLQQQNDEQHANRAVREFVRILGLLRQYPAAVVEAAIADALRQGGHVHHDAVQLYVQHRLAPQTASVPLDLQTQPRLQQIGMQPIDLKRYDELLASGGAA